MHANAAPPQCHHTLNKPLACAMPPPPAIADCTAERCARTMLPPKPEPRTFSVVARPAARRSQPGKDFLQRLREAGL
jgi:hypothetical protein